MDFCQNEINSSWSAHPPRYTIEDYYVSKHDDRKPLSQEALLQVGEESRAGYVRLKTVHKQLQRLSTRTNPIEGVLRLRADLHEKIWSGRPGVTANPALELLWLHTPEGEAWHRRKHGNAVKWAQKKIVVENGSLANSCKLLDPPGPERLRSEEDAQKWCAQCSTICNAVTRSDSSESLPEPSDGAGGDLQVEARPSYSFYSCPWTRDSRKFSPRDSLETDPTATTWVWWWGTTNGASCFDVFNCLGSELPWGGPNTDIFRRAFIAALESLVIGIHQKPVHDSSEQGEEDIHVLTGEFRKDDLWFYSSAPSSEEVAVSSGDSWRSSSNPVFRMRAQSRSCRMPTADFFHQENVPDEYWRTLNQEGRDAAVIFAEAGGIPWAVEDKSQDAVNKARMRLGESRGLGRERGPISMQQAFEQFFLEEKLSDATSLSEKATSDATRITRTYGAYRQREHRDWSKLEAGIRHFAPTFNAWQLYWERHYAPASSVVALSSSNSEIFKLPYLNPLQDKKNYFSSMNHDHFPPLIPPRTFSPDGPAAATYVWGRLVGNRFPIGINDGIGFDPFNLGAAFKSPACKFFFTRFTFIAPVFPNWRSRTRILSTRHDTLSGSPREDVVLFNRLCLSNSPSPRRLGRRQRLWLWLSQTARRSDGVYCRVV